MTEDWNPTDELKKDIVSAIYRDISDQMEEMVEDLGCPRSFAEDLLTSIANNFKDGKKSVKNESSYSSRHTSTPDNEIDAKEIVTKYERKERTAPSDLLRSFNKKQKVPVIENIKSSLYSSRHISTKEEEKGAEEIVTKHEKIIRKNLKAEESKNKNQKA